MALHSVFLGIGSNIEPHKNIPAGLETLSSHFKKVRVSSLYLSEAVGFSAPPFLNLVAHIQTHLDIASLINQLRAIEYQFGRSATASKFSSRRLDIDLLTYDELAGSFYGAVLPRAEIFFNAHVLLPFAELAPDLILPNQNRSLQELWASFNNTYQKISKIDYSETVTGIESGFTMTPFPQVRAAY